MSFFARPYQSNIEEILSVLYLIAALLAEERHPLASMILFGLAGLNLITSIYCAWATRNSKVLG